MSKKNFRITVLSVPDRENLVAEISYNGKGWVEISAEVPNEFVIAFCNKEDANYWEFPYEEALEVLEEAKKQLAEKQRTPEQQAEYDAWVEKYKDWKPTPEEQKEYEAKMEAQRKKYYE